MPTVNVIESLGRSLGDEGLANCGVDCGIDLSVNLKDIVRGTKEWAAAREWKIDIFRVASVINGAGLAIPLLKNPRAFSEMPPLQEPRFGIPNDVGCLIVLLASGALVGGVWLNNKMRGIREGRDRSEEFNPSPKGSEIPSFNRYLQTGDPSVLPDYRDTDVYVEWRGRINDIPGLRKQFDQFRRDHPSAEDMSIFWADVNRSRSNVTKAEFGQGMEEVREEIKGVQHDLKGVHRNIGELQTANLSALGRLDRHETIIKRVVQAMTAHTKNEYRGKQNKPLQLKAKN